MKYTVITKKRFSRAFFVLLLVSFTKFWGNEREELSRNAAQVAKEFYKNNVQSVEIKGLTIWINSDCSSFVRAVYWVASDGKVDLYEESIESGSVVSETGSGVIILAKYFQNKHRFKKNEFRSGDIIFFDNTYDKNNNQKWDDPLTHAGIVTDIREDGTIEFIHGNFGKKIKKGYVNFQHANTARHNGEQVNTYLRKRYPWENSSYKSLTAYLVRAFGGFSM